MGRCGAAAALTLRRARQGYASFDLATNGSGGHAGTPDPAGPRFVRRLTLSAARLCWAAPGVGLLRAVQ
jgi:hypothetical protein